MRIGQLTTTLLSLATNEATAHHSVMILGPAGVGKSVSCRAAAAHLGRRIIDVRLSQMDPTDLRGIPGRENGMTTWAPPSFLPREGDGPCVLFLDEANAAPPAVAAAAYQLILDRRLGDYVVPDDCLIWAAGNLASDRGVTFTMPAPLTNRFIMFTVEANIDDFKAHAAAVGIDARIIAFLSNRSDYLHQFNGKDYVSGAQFPTPRGWERVSDLLKLTNVPDFVRNEAIAGSVGKTAGEEFNVFCKIYASVVSVAEVLKDPGNAPIPSDIGGKYSVAMSLSSNMSKFNADQMYIYLKRMSREFQMLAIFTAYNRLNAKNKAGELMMTAMFNDFSRDILDAMGLGS